MCAYAKLLCSILSTMTRPKKDRQNSNCELHSMDCNNVKDWIDVDFDGNSNEAIGIERIYFVIQRLNDNVMVMAQGWWWLLCFFVMHYATNTLLQITTLQPGCFTSICSSYRQGENRCDRDVVRTSNGDRMHVKLYLPVYQVLYCQR